MLLERKHRQKCLISVCLCACVASVCLNKKANVHVFVFKSRVCTSDSQLRGVLGNALGQRVQPSVAASHHAV